MRFVPINRRDRINTLNGAIRNAVCDILSTEVEVKDIDYSDAITIATACESVTKAILLDAWAIDIDGQGDAVEMEVNSWPLWLKELTRIPTLFSLERTANL